MEALLIRRERWDRVRTALSIGCHLSLMLMPVLAVLAAVAYHVNAVPSTVVNAGRYLEY